MSPTIAPFEAPIRKLDWGLHRTDELARHLKNYEASNPVRLKQTETEIILEREKSPPPELPLVLGDAIHNLRAALDLLACDLVRLNQKNPKNVSFPFALNAEDLKEQIRQKNFYRAAPVAIDLLHKIGPHHEGNKELRGLHDLDIMDKHRLIIPVFQAFDAKQFRIEGPSGLLEFDASGPGDGFSVSAQPGDKASFESIVFHVVFGEDAPKVFRGTPIIETLKGLAQLVGGIIESFRKLYVG